MYKRQTESTIKTEVEKHYGIKVDDIKVVNGGSANIYKLTSDKGKKYILKEFQSKFSGKTILKEINIINFLKNKGLSVPEYVTCLNGKQYFEYNDKTIIIQNFIEGNIQGNYSGNVDQMLESAKYLGIIVNALEDVYKRQVSTVECDSTFPITRYFLLLFLLIHCRS